MGLDMYLYRKAPEMEEAEEIGYWRKVNAVHKWFSDHNDHELEDCEDMQVTKDMLLQLKADCEQVINGSCLEDALVENGECIKGGQCTTLYTQSKAITNTSVAERVLPTQSGFFFGQLGYNQWYINGLEHTVDIIDRALRIVDWDHDEVFYMAWW